MTPSSLQRRVRRLQRETFGSYCPCGYTTQWAGVWSEILTKIEQPAGSVVAQARCVRCDGLVPRPTATEVQALIGKIECQQAIDLIDRTHGGQ